MFKILNILNEVYHTVSMPHLRNQRIAAPNEGSLKYSNININIKRLIRSQFSKRWTASVCKLIYKVPTSICPMLIGLISTKVTPNESSDSKKRGLRFQSTNMLYWIQIAENINPTNISISLAIKCCRSTKTHGSQKQE